MPKIEKLNKKTTAKKKRPAPALATRARLTARQQKVLDFVVDTIQKYGYPPTLREIGEHMGIKSTNGVSDHLKALERKGYLKKSSLRARALTPILDVNATNANQAANNDNLRVIPLVGKVAAGVPIPRIESTEKTLLFDSSLVGHSGDIFALEVTGDSMINDGIREGDYLLVRKQPQANNSEIVVAVIDDEVTVKRFYREENRIRLQPANDNLQPIYLTPSAWSDIAVLGVSVGLYRKY